jgi:hypothetical protein
MLIALNYLGSVGRGVTRPQLFRATDGKVYVVKLQNNRLGPKVLANELLGARFGETLGLCFPPGDVIKIDEQVLKNSRRILPAGIIAGRHFGCLFLNNTRYLGPYNLYKAINKEEMAGVMLFDHLFHNFDRTLNWRNLLLRREGREYRIYAIDNSHLFRRGRWTQAWLDELAPKIKINRIRTYGTLLKRCLRPEFFASYLAKIQQISDASLQAMVEEIPAEWLPHASDREALQRFLVMRRDMAGDIVTCLCALIPDKHRRANIDEEK